MNPAYQYRPYTHNPHTWAYIQQCFETDFDGTRPMAELAQHIQDSGAAVRLFGYLYGETLIVCNDAPVDPRKDALHIDFDRYTQKWHFQYYAAPFKAAQFERFYPLADGIKKFDQFLRMIRW